jgi:uncharacterized protein (DUF2147 family)
MYKHLLIMLLLFCSSIAFSQHKDQIIGKWLNATGEAHIQIYPNGGKYFGKIAWMKTPNDPDGKPRLDKNNPENGLMKNPILGLVILKDFVYNDHLWQGGSIYDPKTGKTYSCKISLQGSDKMNVRGFVGFSMLGRTESWTRIK